MALCGVGGRVFKSTNRPRNGEERSLSLWDEADMSSSKSQGHGYEQWLLGDHLRGKMTGGYLIYKL